MNLNWYLLSTALLMVLSVGVCATKPTSAELSRCNKWTIDHFGDGKHLPSAEPPFSFDFGGLSFNQVQPNWSKTCTSKKLTQGRIERTVSYTDPASGLEVECRAVQYSDYPTVEWTLKFKNSGKDDTPIISDIRPLDVTWNRNKTTEFNLHWNTADNCSQDSYGPHETLLSAGYEFKTASAGGRPTTGAYPYWNVEFDGGGAIVVLSWGGQWSAQFQRDEANALRMRAGQELTHFKLHPGEEVTSPLAIVQFYQGDWIRGQNIWRRWMIALNLPHPGGKLIKPFTYGCDGEFMPGLRTNIEGEKKSIDRFHKEKVVHNAWDQDAGWYPCGDAWWNTGDWRPDPERFPKGVKELSDFLHERGIKLTLWFEPERAIGGSWLAVNHPDWIFGGTNGGLVKLGEPEAWKWIVEKFDGLIKSEGVDIYRQDFNIDPLGYWRGNDTEDRQGITEIRHVEGYYAYWDELLRRNPHLLIDTCASGGRRNNVQTLRRSVPLLRSDYQIETIGSQGMTYGLSMWVPLFGAGQYPTSVYDMRSSMCPVFAIGGDVRKADLDWNLMRKSYKEWKELSACMYGDYYPLTAYSLEKNVWMGWQFDVPEKGKGVVQVFRREETTSDSIVVKPRGLDPEAKYEVKNFDLQKPEIRSGSDLMKSGIKVVIGAKPGAAILSYRKLK
jgi:alpha-galactosidase